jgi:hypothetical protein
MELFGFEIKKKAEEENTNSKSFVVPSDDTLDDGEGTIVRGAGSNHGTYYDLNFDTIKEEKIQIEQYRDIAQHPEVDAAIEDIVNEAIVTDESSSPVRLIVDDVEASDKVKKLLIEEFENIVKMLNFNWLGSDLFRIWYVDGRIYFHKMIDENNPKNGLKEIRHIDSTKIKKVKEVEKETDPNTGVEFVKKVNEYYIFQEYGMGATTNALKINKDAICSVSSGLLNTNRTRTLSYLHKALKPTNQLRMMEDALVIYRLARAPERRVFYIDVGNLPKNKAESYLASVMANYRNKIVYNAETGQVDNKTNQMSMLEDFWLPRREGGRGTEITTLPGGENLGQIDDITYFKSKLYRSLNVPVSRLDPENQAMVSLGRASETTRDELKFQKFVSKMRKKFSTIFIDLLRTQVLLKGIFTEDEWEEHRQNFAVDFIKDSYFSEMKNSELLRERVATLREVDEFVGKYYSKEWVRKNILMQSDEDITQIDKQITAEPNDLDDFDIKEDVVTEGKVLNDIPVDNARQLEIEEKQLQLITSMTKIMGE